MQRGNSGHCSQIMDAIRYDPVAAKSSRKPVTEPQIATADNWWNRFNAPNKPVFNRFPCVKVLDAIQHLANAIFWTWTKPKNSKCSWINGYRVRRQAEIQAIVGPLLSFNALRFKKLKLNPSSSERRQVHTFEGFTDWKLSLGQRATSSSCCKVTTATITLCS